VYTHTHTLDIVPAMAEDSLSIVKKQILRLAEAYLTPSVFL